MKKFSLFVSVLLISNFAFASHEEVELKKLVSELSSEMTSLWGEFGIMKTTKDSYVSSNCLQLGKVYKQAILLTAYYKGYGKLRKYDPAFLNLAILSDEFSFSIYSYCSSSFYAQNYIKLIEIAPKFHLDVDEFNRNLKSSQLNN